MSPYCSQLFAGQRVQNMTELYAFLSPNVVSVHQGHLRCKWSVKRRDRSRQCHGICSVHMCVSSSLPQRNVSRRVAMKSLGVGLPLSLILPVISGETTTVLNDPSTATADTMITGSKERLSDIDPREAEPEITDRAYLDFSLDGGAKSRVTIGLYGGIAPETVANFIDLLKDGYAGTKVYRVVPGLTVQMGDVLRNGGKSGRSASGTPLPQENFRVMHSIPGIVSMAHDQKGMVDSRFFVNTRPGDSLYLDGKYCGFGRVLDNMEFLYEVERAADRRGGFASRLPKVVIERCGLLS